MGDVSEMKNRLHKKVDDIVEALNQNLKVFLESVKIPEQNTSTVVNQDLNLNNCLQMEIATDKVVS